MNGDRRKVRSSELPDLPFERRVDLSGSRLERHFRNMLSQTDAHLIAHSTVTGGKLDFEMLDPGAEWLGNLFGVRLYLPALTTAKAGAFGLPDPPIYYALEPMTVFNLTPKRAQRSNPLLNRGLAIAASQMLMTYWADQIETMTSTSRYQKEKLPSAWAFGRVVRNAFAHGAVSMNDPNATVTWHGMSISSSDNGREIIFEDLKFSDLVILVLEMDAELGRYLSPDPGK